MLRTQPEKGEKSEGNRSDALANASIRGWQGRSKDQGDGRRILPKVSTFTRGLLKSH